MNGLIGSPELAFLSVAVTHEGRRVFSHHKWSRKGTESWMRDWLADTCALRKIDYRLITLTVTWIEVDYFQRDNFQVMEWQPEGKVMIRDAVSALGKVVRQ